MKKFKRKQETSDRSTRSHGYQESVVNIDSAKCSDGSRTPRTASSKKQFEPSHGKRRKVATKSSSSTDGTLPAEEGSARHSPARDYSDISAQFFAEINIRSKDNERMDCHITGSAILPGRKLVLADYNNGRIKVIDTRECVMISELECDGKPWSVCMIDEHSLAATVPLSHRILMIEIGTDAKLSVRERMPTKEKCMGIAMLDDRMFVTARTSRTLILIMDTFGKVLQAINMDKRLFKTLQHVTLGTDNHCIYISDVHSHKVVCVNFDGAVKATYKDGQLSLPGQVAVDKRGLLYIAGYQSNNIHVVTPECRKVKLLLDESNGIKDVLASCYCEETARLYIGMHNCNTVKVFQLSQ